MAKLLTVAVLLVATIVGFGILIIIAVKAADEAGEGR